MDAMGKDTRTRVADARRTLEFTLVLFGGGGRALVFALKRKGSGAATKMRGAKR